MMNKKTKDNDKEISVSTHSNIGTEIEIAGKKKIYEIEREKNYFFKHPVKSIIRNGSNILGTAVGGAVAGPGGAVAGNKIGKELGKSLTKSKNESIDFSKIYRSKEYTKAISEYFDITDNNTRKILLAIDENDQNKVLMNLTSKLYDNIINKVDDIDFGEIPMSKGDITKLSNYNNILDCTDTIRRLLLEFNQSTEPVDVVKTAISNLRDSTDIWKKAFNLNIELPMILYNSIVLAIVQSTAYLISMSIEYIKIPSQDSFKVVIDRSALYKTKDHMLFDNLRKFNDAFKKGQVISCMNYLIKENVKNFTGEIGAGAALFGISTLLFCIVPIIRELIFLFFYTTVRISDFFEIQADMLQMNSYNVQHNRPDLSKEEKEKISTKQMKIADKMRDISKKISIDVKTSENNTIKEMTKQNRKYKVDDVMEELPDSASSVF